MKDLILITDGKTYEFDNLEQLKEFLMPGQTKETKEQLINNMYEKIFGFSMLNNLQIVETSKGVYKGNYEIGTEKMDIDKAIVIDNLDTYILSLCKFNAIVLLENRENRCYTNNIEVNSEEKKYIVVNQFAGEILNRMVGDAT